MLQRSSKIYIALASQIRLYSAPQLQDIKSGHEYHSTLIRNFTEIGALSVDINRILDEDLYPLLEEGRELSDREFENLTSFSRGLVDMYTLTSLDAVLCFLISQKLVAESERRQDDCAKIRALDSMVESCFAMMEISLRLTPCSDAGYDYRAIGLDAGAKLLSYLDKTRFAAIPDEDCREKVLINSRYLTALLFWNGADRDDEDREDLDLLERSLSLADDPFYRELAPNYNWDYHVFRCLQYMVSYSERLNMRHLAPDLLERLHSRAERLLSLWESDEETYRDFCPHHTLQLYLSRLSFLTGRLTGPEYKASLRKLMDQANLFRFGIHDNIANLFSLDEYLLAVKACGVDEQDQISLGTYYRNLALYIHRMPKLGSISFVVSILSHILKDYADLPIGGFEESCLQIVAAMHPLTYVHSLTVSALARLLASRLLKKRPELFIGFSSCSTTEEVLSHEDEILYHAEHAALCHDIGKLFVIELIMTYGRRLTDREFELIKSHTDIGAHVLRQHADTACYAAVAHCHHDNYDKLDERFSEGGYPLSERTFIEITSCADSMDAATDAVGRSYKKGKQFEEVLAEFEEGRGTRYAPHVVDLFHDSEVAEEVKQILSVGREENYRRAYKFLSRLADTQNS